MNTKEIERFEKIATQLDGFYEEIGNLTKKSPNDGVNKFKLKLINKLLLESNSILGERYRPFDDFVVFEEDDLPSNSDVTSILSQYINCLEKLRSDNIQNEYTTWYWKIDGKVSSIRTAAPKKIGKR